MPTYEPARHEGHCWVTDELMPIEQQRDGKPMRWSIANQYGCAEFRYGPNDEPEDIIRMKHEAVERLNEITDKAERQEALHCMSRYKISGEVYPPVKWVAQQFGGYAVLSSICNVHYDTPRKWLNGQIPAMHMSVILRESRARGLDITAEDLINGRFVGDKHPQGVDCEESAQ